MSEAVLDRIGGAMLAAPAPNLTIESPQALHQPDVPRDRRAHVRHPHEALAWVRAARLQSGEPVRLLDLSTGGARLSSPVALGPNSRLALEIVAADGGTLVPFRVLRCEVGGITAAGITYHGACEFMRPLDLPALAHSTPAPPEATDLLRIDLALKALLARAAAASQAERLPSDKIEQVLRALHARAAQAYTDRIGRRVAALLEVAASALAQRRGSVGVSHLVIGALDTHLHHIVPHASLRLTGAAAPAAGGIRAMIIGVPDGTAPGPLVTLLMPEGTSLTRWQSGALQALTGVIALLQQLEPAVLIDGTARPASSIAPEVRAAAVVIRSTPAVPVQPVPPAAQSEAAPAQPPMSGAAPTAWQMVVARYADGHALKGFTSDFHASRSHFTMVASPTTNEADAVIVPLVRLKAVFFVRDFAGNPDYIERTDGVDLQAGRRIEVTLHDGEVLVGTTLNYRSDGQGFFVTPIDPETNNIRVFVVANAVRQVRFPTGRTASSRLEPTPASPPRRS